MPRVIYSNIGEYFRYKSPEQIVTEAWESLSTAIRQDSCNHTMLNAIPHELDACTKCLKMVRINQRGVKWKTNQL